LPTPRYHESEGESLGKKKKENRLKEKRPREGLKPKRNGVSAFNGKKHRKKKRKDASPIREHPKSGKRMAKPEKRREENGDLFYQRRSLHPSKEGELTSKLERIFGGKKGAHRNPKESVKYASKERPSKDQRGGKKKKAGNRRRRERLGGKKSRDQGELRASNFLSEEKTETVYPKERKGSLCDQGGVERRRKLQAKSSPQKEGNRARLKEIFQKIKRSLSKTIEKREEGRHGGALSWRGEGRQPGESQCTIGQGSPYHTERCLRESQCIPEEAKKKLARETKVQIKRENETTA